MPHTALALYALGAGAVTTSLVKLKKRFDLSKAKHPSLSGHSRMARRLASMIPFYEYDNATFFRCDGAPAEIAARREAGFERLAELYRERYPKTLALTAETKGSISDLQFTEAYRVPFQFRRLVKQDLPVGSFLKSSSGVTVTDLDGNRFYDLTGSYGVNLFGYDFYKECIAKGATRVSDLGPVLGSYHPDIAYNVARLREISGLDEVSFHMSGTEAVMQAVRLARYHTRRTHLVRFCGAYHGWWGDVAPGVGNPVPARETYTLQDMSEQGLRVIADSARHCMRAGEPAAGAASERQCSILTRRWSTAVGRRPLTSTAYADWLRRLRAICSERGIVFILDEVFLGFRVALGGAQEYFGVRADLVSYGKTLGGGLPIGVLCGRKELMRQFHDDRPADICFARGTFNSHPYVMGAMYEFLQRLQTPEILKSLR